MKKRLLMLAAALLLAWLPTARAESGRELILTLTLGGDCVLGTREEWMGQPDAFDTVIEKEGTAYPFSGLQDIFAHDDMTLVNLECVLQDNSTGKAGGKQYIFRGDPTYTDMLKEGSVEQVNIANNHTIDFGRTGQASTRAALEAAQIPYSGNRALYIWEIDDVKIGFGGCRETTFLESNPVVYRDIQALKKAGCDVIVFSCHWGREYSPTHNKTQQRMAQYAVNSGADIIVGTHPHVVQGLELRMNSKKTHNALVLYSLGNLVFGGTHDMTTFDAALIQLKLHFVDGKYTGVDMELIPVLTSGSAPLNDFRPVVAQGDDKARILQKIQDDTELALVEKMAFQTEGKYNLLVDATLREDAFLVQE